MGFTDIEYQVSDNDSIVLDSFLSLLFNLSCNYLWINGLGLLLFWVSVLSFCVVFLSFKVLLSVWSVALTIVLSAIFSTVWSVSLELLLLKGSIVSLIPLIALISGVQLFSNGSAFVLERFSVIIIRKISGFWLWIERTTDSGPEIRFAKEFSWLIWWSTNLIRILFCHFNTEWMSLYSTII